MAVSGTLLTSNFDNVDAVSFTTASVSPAANSLLIVGEFLAAATTAGTANITDSSGLLTWTTQIHDLDGGRSAGIHTAQCGASPGSFTITVNQTGGDATHTGCGHAVVQVTGHDSGTPVVQTKLVGGDGSTNTAGVEVTGTLTTDPSGRPNNRVFCFWQTRLNETITPRANWTELSENLGTAPNSTYETQWRDDGTNEATYGATWATGVIRYIGLAIEIAAAVSTPVIGDWRRLLPPAPRSGVHGQLRHPTEKVSGVRPIYGPSTAAAGTQFPQALDATQVQTPTLTTQLAFARTLSATEIQTPSVVRQVGHIVPTVTQTQTLTVAKQIGHIIPTVTETQTPSLIKSVGKLLSATEVQTATLVASKAFLRALTATQVQTATIVRSVGKVLTRTVTQTPSFVRQVGKILTVTETETPTVTKQIPKTLTATQVQTASIVKRIGKTLSAVGSQIVSLVTQFIAAPPPPTGAPPLGPMRSYRRPAPLEVRRPAIHRVWRSAIRDYFRPSSIRRRRPGAP
jgi:hypothetical protein